MAAARRGEAFSVLWRQPTAPVSLERMSAGFPRRGRSKPSLEMFTSAADRFRALQGSVTLADKAERAAVCLRSATAGFHNSKNIGGAAVQMALPSHRACGAPQLGNLSTG